MSAALELPRLVRLATWLGQRWCWLTTGHRYIRHPDPWEPRRVCWTCGHESDGWPRGEQEVKTVSLPRARRRAPHNGRARW